MKRYELEQKATKNVCACWYWDLVNALEETPSAELRKIIANPYHIHEVMDKGENWQAECWQYTEEHPELAQEQAEAIRDEQREDGIAV